VTFKAVWLSSRSHDERIRIDLSVAKSFLQHLQRALVIRACLIHFWAINGDIISRLVSAQKYAVARLG